MESVAKMLDDAICHNRASADVTSISIGQATLAAIPFQQVVGYALIYFVMGGIFVAFALISIGLAFLLTRRLRNPLAKILIRTAVMGVFLAPTVAAGEGGIYVGPGYLELLQSATIIPSMLITWAVFFVLSVLGRYVWVGKIR